MKYRIKKETKPKLPTFGKYKAVAVHERTISSDMIVKEVCEQHPYDESVTKALLIRISEVVNRHLREGDRVRLEEWGMMKLEIESEKVDSPEEFRPKKHIRSVRLHIIPESENGKPVLYKGIEFKKEKI